MINKVAIMQLSEMGSPDSPSVSPLATLTKNPLYESSPGNFSLSCKITSRMIYLPNGIILLKLI